MKAIHTIVVTALFALPIGAYAGPGGAGHTHGDSHKHEHAIDKDRAIENGRTTIDRHIEKGTLDASWSKAKLVNAEKNKDGWLVTFNNPSAADVNKQTLYVFLTIGGQYVAANFTGK